jgi:hypothetical protein
MSKVAVGVGKRAVAPLANVISNFIRFFAVWTGAWSVRESSLFYHSPSVKHSLQRQPRWQALRKPMRLSFFSLFAIAMAAAAVVYFGLGLIPVGSKAKTDTVAVTDSVFSKPLDEAAAPESGGAAVAAPAAAPEAASEASSEPTVDPAAEVAVDPATDPAAVASTAAGAEVANTETPVEPTPEASAPAEPVAEPVVSAEAPPASEPAAQASSGGGLSKEALAKIIAEAAANAARETAKTVAEQTARDLTQR